MIMKSNLGKVLGRIAPQQNAQMPAQQPQLGGGLMALMNRPNPQSGMTPSNMLANLGQMLSGQRPTRPTNTGNGMLVMPAIPQPYQQGPMAQPHIYNPVNTTTERDLRGPRGMGGMRNMFGVNPNDLAAMGGILPKLAEQFRNAEAMPSNWVSAPRTLTPEEQIAITSMPATRTAPAQPAPTSFDRNAALQAFNARAAEMNASGKGLFNSGVSPDEFRMYQGILRNLQLNPNSTPEQHADILNKSMAFLNQYSGSTPQPMVDPNVPYRPTGPDAFYGAPPAPAQQIPQNAQGVALGKSLGMARQPQGMTLSNVPQQQRLTLSNVPMQGTTPQPMSAPQGMAMGGLMKKYYGGGMC